MKRSLSNTLLLLSIALLSAAKLTAQTPAITFNYLAPYNALGVPDNLETTNDVIAPDFLTDINTALPETKPVPSFHPEYIVQKNETDVVLNAKADIWITFVHEGAGYTNALGFYTYPAATPPTSVADIKSYTIIFPNVSYDNSGGGLKSGNKVYLGNFEANSGIGWFVVADAFKNGKLTQGKYIVYSEPALNPEKDPALKAHTVLLHDSKRNKLILGFEDVLRDQGSDQDFNDMIFYISGNPYTAIKTDDVVLIPSGTTPTSTNPTGTSTTGTTTTTNPTGTTSGTTTGTTTVTPANPSILVNPTTTTNPTNTNSNTTTNNNNNSININNNVNNNAGNGGTGANNTNNTTTTNNVNTGTSTTNNTNTNSNNTTTNNNTNTNTNSNNTSNNSNNNTATTVVNNTTIINNNGGGGWGGNRTHNTNTNNNTTTNNNGNSGTGTSTGTTTNTGGTSNTTGGYNTTTNTNTVSSNVTVCNLNGISITNFNALKNTIKSQYVESNKSIIIKQAVQSKKVTVSQVSEIIKLIVVDQYKLDMAIYLFDHTCDKSNYYQINALLNASRVRDLQDYLKDKDLTDDNVTSVNTSVTNGSTNTSTQNTGNTSANNNSSTTSGCNSGRMSDDDFDNIKQRINAQAFSDSKMRILKEAMPTRCISSIQVKDMLTIFSFESDKMTAAKYLYKFTSDKQNYYKVNDSFSFSSSVDELSRFIQTGK